MSTTINLHQMQMASTISDHFKNPHKNGSRAWHTHNRKIQRAATEIASIPFKTSKGIERGKIWGILENLEKDLKKLG